MDGEAFQALADEVMAERLSEEDPFVVEIGSNDTVMLRHFATDGMRVVLKPGRAMIFEDPYVDDIAEKSAYDQIYDGHAYYFPKGSISYPLEQHDLGAVQVMAQAAHRGSMRHTTVRVHIDRCWMRCSLSTPSWEGLASTDQTPVGDSGFLSSD